MCPLCEDGKFIPCHYCKFCQGTSSFQEEFIQQLKGLTDDVDFDLDAFLEIDPDLGGGDE